ncbi:MerR family transcriptional regulator [Ligilactobacillus salivarius]|uniref:MerR family transcriptional regulator n=1 Tax=Ligilactobacillus salivarius TaxID=1624 RepID=A0A9X6S5U2_9LACO|nr:MerR family transcriptional regulator [Ligilactobacillus salivarius]MCI6063275.1 MerR family transcriptional regulator [Ligilactobacillus salivarius]MDY5291625.1 MerR family transcriptional regulator [Ligilactobacillus salivarius]PAY28177.1 MerR family transcriptional regulator [Ligilactobacillus salivarius]PAY30229.1 MerR family transcriptional regulator [Ligilactobacillus salivarius]PAY31314.1 MerR family transcriptional regulator [Ligilactobacillus salivarius]
MKTEEKIYRIGEIAEMFDLSKSTIRFYEEIGLFPNLKRSPGGLRLFSQEEINCIEDVECLKKTGMSLKDIAAYVSWKQEGDSSLLARLNLIRNQRLTLEQNIRNLEKELTKLTHKQWYYEQAVTAGTESIFNGDCEYEYYRAHPDEQQTESEG